MYGVVVFSGNVQMMFVRSKVVRGGFRASLSDCDGPLNVLRASRTE